MRGLLELSDKDQHQKKFMQYVQELNDLLDGKD